MRETLCNLLNKHFEMYIDLLALAVSHRRSEGMSSRDISSPGGGADQDQVFQCRVVVVSCRVVALQKPKNVMSPENKQNGLDQEVQRS